MMNRVFKGRHGSASIPAPVNRDFFPGLNTPNPSYKSSFESNCSNAYQQEHSKIDQISSKQSLKLKLMIYYIKKAAKSLKSKVERLDRFISSKHTRTIPKKNHNFYGNSGLKGSLYPSKTRHKMKVSSLKSRARKLKNAIKFTLQNVQAKKFLLSSFAPKNKQKLESEPKTDNSELMKQVPVQQSFGTRNPMPVSPRSRNSRHNSYHLTQTTNGNHRTTASTRALLKRTVRVSSAPAMLSPNYGPNYTNSSPLASRGYRNVSFLLTLSGRLINRRLTPSRVHRTNIRCHATFFHDPRLDQSSHVNQPTQLVNVTNVNPAISEYQQNEDDIINQTFDSHTLSLTDSISNFEGELSNLLSQIRSPQDSGYYIGPRQSDESTRSKVSTAVNEHLDSLPNTDGSSRTDLSNSLENLINDLEHMNYRLRENELLFGSIRSRNELIETLIRDNEYTGISYNLTQNEMFIDLVYHDVQISENFTARLVNETSSIRLGAVQNDSHVIRENLIDISARILNIGMDHVGSTLDRERVYTNEEETWSRTTNALNQTVGNNGILSYYNVQQLMQSNSINSAIGEIISSSFTSRRIVTVMLNSPHSQTNSLFRSFAFLPDNTHQAFLVMYTDEGQIKWITVELHTNYS